MAPKLRLRLCSQGTKLKPEKIHIREKIEILSQENKRQHSHVLDENGALVLTLKVTYEAAELGLPASFLVWRWVLLGTLFLALPVAAEPGLNRDV